MNYYVLCNAKKYLDEYVNTKLKPNTAETISWFGLLLLITAPIPSFLAVINGLTDKLPSIDIVLIIWFTLLLFFLRSIILKDFVSIVTIGLGFMINATIMAFILFN